MWETSHIRRSLQWDCVNSKKWTNGDARLTENDEINVVTCYAEDMRYVYVAQSPSHKDSPSLHVLGNLGVAFAEGHIVLALQLSMKIYLNLHSAPYLYIQCESNKHPTNSGRDVLRSLNEESKKTAGDSDTELRRSCSN